MAGVGTVIKSYRTGRDILPFRQLTAREMLARTPSVKFSSNSRISHAAISPNDGGV